MQFFTTSFPTSLTSILNSKAAARVLAIVLLAVLCALCTHFALKLLYGAPAPSSTAASALSVSADAPAPTWLQGGAVSAAPATSDYKLLGIVAQGTSGLALIQATGNTGSAANNKRPQIVRVGQSLSDGVRLVSVLEKSVVLDIQGLQRTLSLEASNKAGLGASLIAGNTGNAGAMGANPSYGAAASSATAANDAAIQAQLAQQQIQQIQAQQAIAPAQDQVRGGDNTQSQNAAQVNEQSIPPSMRKRFGGRVQP